MGELIEFALLKNNYTSKTFDGGMAKEMMNYK
jgi:hypothetical protein